MRRDEVSRFRAVELLVCPSCGRSYPPGVRFCAGDGRELVRPPQVDDPLVGTVVGHYRIERALGGGGSGRVYAATHAATGQRCAIKVLHRDVARDAEGMRRFRREAANHARLAAHPHVCALLEVGTTRQGLVYIAMEYVDGETLRDRLAREHRLPPPRVATIVRQTASALAAAHGVGLVHRDLKPENVMLARRPDGADHVVLIDFGVAKRPLDTGQSLTRSGISVGTPQFMSPEQLGAEPVDARSDVYSLALVTFVMLAGELPFPARGPQGMILRLAGVLRPLAEVCPGVPWPPSLQRCLDRGLALHAADRHRSAMEFAAELGRVIDRSWDGRGWTAESPVVEAAVPAPADAATAPATGGGGWLSRLTWRGRKGGEGGDGEARPGR